MKKCMQCGAEMPDEEVFCSECGTELALNKEVQETLIEDAVVISTEETAETAPVLEEEANLEDVLDEVEAETKPAEPIPEKPVSKKKIKWWHIAIPVTAVVAIVAVLLLGPFFIYLSPQTVLAKALAETAEDLSARAEGTPLTVMDKAYDESQKYSMAMNIDASQPMIGDIHIGMDAKVDYTSNQTLVGLQADILGLGQELDVNLYTDREVTAIHVDRITGKDYYGIYYDTFGEDIRNNDFMYQSLGENNIVMMEELVDMLEQMMNLERITPEQQAESLKKYGDAILEFVIQKDASVEKASVSVDGKDRNCKTIGFVINHEEYAELIEKLIDIAETDPLMIYYYQSTTMDFTEEGWHETLEDAREDLEEFKEEGDGECEIIFYLHGGKVVQIDVAVEEDSDVTFSCCLNFGSDASVTDITISGFDTEEDGNPTITLSTQKNGDVVTESLVFAEEDDDEDVSRAELGYEWNRKNGSLILYFQEDDEDRYEVECVLEELENGFRFSIPAMEDLIEYMVEDTEGMKMSMDITMTTGAEIEVPEIKDIAKMTQLEVMSIAMKLMELMEM